MYILLIIGLIIFVIGVLLHATKHESSFLIGILGAWIMSAASWAIGDNKHPTALDVYRGKTTLVITYKDSIAVDSVVVYK